MNCMKILHISNLQKDFHQRLFSWNDSSRWSEILKNEKVSSVWTELVFNVIFPKTQTDLSWKWIRYIGFLHTFFSLQHCWNITAPFYCRKLTQTVSCLGRAFPVEGGADQGFPHKATKSIFILHHGRSHLKLSGCLFVSRCVCARVQAYWRHTVIWKNAHNRGWKYVLIKGLVYLYLQNQSSDELKHHKLTFSWMNVCEFSEWI